MTELNTSARAVLVERARRLAQPLAGIEEGDIGEENRASVLVVRLGDERVGVPLDYTTEVYRTTELTPIPGARSPVAGAIAWRGRVLTILDIAHNRREPVAMTDATRILVIGQRTAAFGILADEVEDVQHLNTNAIRPVENVSPARSEIVRGTTADGIVVLDAAALIVRFAPTQQSGGPRE